MAGIGHWDTIIDFLRKQNVPEWIQGEDRNRIGAYDLYEAIYWTAPEAFQITMRGQEGEPIYVPSGRQVVDTAHRFMAPQMKVAIDPDFGDEAIRQQAELYMRDFAMREELYAKFSSGKLHGLMRGDWLWHVIADPSKPKDSRVSVHELSPSNYFPVETSDEDRFGDRLVGVIIAEPEQDGDDTVIHRTVYTLVNGRVTVKEDICKVDEWGQPDTEMPTKIIRTIAEEIELPEPIDQIPVYHIPNQFDFDEGWGSSEMRGIELLMRGINQGVTDEELALVLDGIGVYVTDAGAPLDETGAEMSWTVAVGHVLELPSGKKFERVQGVGTIQPYIDHIKYLHDQIDQTTGANDITRGRADVAVAESGIALALRMGPILSRMSEKELVVTSRMSHLLFDLCRWFAAYEDLGGLLDIRFKPLYGDKLPPNKKELFDRVISMLGTKPPIVSGAEARRMLSLIGIVFSEESVLNSEIDGDIRRLADAEAVRIGVEAGGAA